MQGVLKKMKDEALKTSDGESSAPAEVFINTREISIRLFLWKIRSLQEEIIELKERLEAEKQIGIEAEQQKNHERVVTEDGHGEQLHMGDSSLDDHPFDLADALDFIKVFTADGPPDELNSFLRSIDFSRKMIGPELEDLLLKGIVGFKFKGTAFKSLKYCTFESIEDLKIHLKCRFGKRINIIDSMRKFSGLKQRDNEDVRGFVQRTQEVIEDYLEGLLSLHPELPEEGKEVVRKIFGTVAKLTFEQGLRSPELQFLVRVDNYKSLRDSCMGAIDLEKTIPEYVTDGTGSSGGSRNSNRSGRASKSRQFVRECFGCGRSGHVAKNCRTMQREQ